jgi:hypothetical protein
MAFDFLGTFTASDFGRLLEFARATLPDVDDRITILKAEIEKLGWVSYSFDEQGERVGYQVFPTNSLMARYTRAYEYYGGSLNDLKIRSRGDWIYITKGEFDLREGVPFSGGQPSDGEYSANNGLYNDATPGIHISKVKDWLIPKIKKMEDLEYRIRRCVDLTDQKIEEIILLVKRSTGAETIEDLRQTVEFFFTSDDYPSVTNV